MAEFGIAEIGMARRTLVPRTVRRVGGRWSGGLARSDGIGRRLTRWRPVLRPGSRAAAAPFLALVLRHSRPGGLHTVVRLERHLLHLRTATVHVGTAPAPTAPSSRAHTVVNP